MRAAVRDIDHAGSWLRSSRCSPELNCVEVGTGETGVLIRDSKSRITLQPIDIARWTAFLTYCRLLKITQRHYPRPPVTTNE